MRVLVCGAGSAGCVIASRLAKTPGVDVLLLERGPYYPPGCWPPRLVAPLFPVIDDHDWGYETADERRTPLPRGKLVGGSGAINGGVALRGHTRQFDAWGEFVEGFSWSTWLPWLSQLEDDVDFGGDPWHGRDGPIVVARHPPSSWSDLQQRFVEAAQQADHEFVEDHNRPDALGVGAIPLTMIDNQRATLSDRYLAGSLDAGRLQLRTGVLVDRVLVERGRATGVRIVGSNQSVETLHADLTVLTLGAYATPAALLRSGLGPVEELHRHGIRTRLSLPGVGRNLIDHPKVPYRFQICGMHVDRAAPPYQVVLTGRHEVDGVERFYQVLPYSGSQPGGTGKLTAFNAQVLDPVTNSGSVSLCSCDPSAQPRIRISWLAAAADRRAAVAIAERIAELIRQPALVDVLEPLDCALGDPRYPRGAAVTFHHPAGTCRIGRSDDPLAVADECGRVLGVSGLHIGDASLFPCLPHANIHLAVLALAERMAAQILEEAAHEAS